MTLVNRYSPADALNLTRDLRTGFAKVGQADRITTVAVKTVINLQPTEGLTVNTVLNRTAKKYIVPFNGKFYAYPLKLEDHPTAKDIKRIVPPLPNIYREGLVSISGEVYYVKLEDLKRGIVRLSRKLPIPAKRTVTYKDLIDGLACTNFADLPDDHPQSATAIALRRAGVTTRPADDTPPAGGAVDQQPPGPSPETELDEELRVADLAFEGQINALYDPEDSEEGW